MPRPLPRAAPERPGSRRRPPPRLPCPRRRHWASLGKARAARRRRGTLLRAGSRRPDGGVFFRRLRLCGGAGGWDSGRRVLLRVAARPAASTVEGGGWFPWRWPGVDLGGGGRRGCVRRRGGWSWRWCCFPSPSPSSAGSGEARRPGVVSGWQRFCCCRVSPVRVGMGCGAVLLLAWCQVELSSSIWFCLRMVRCFRVWIDGSSPPALGSGGGWRAAALASQRWWLPGPWPCGWRGWQPRVLR